jgi:glycosyltransferase involved in cell wall biosynthesis
VFLSVVIPAYNERERLGPSLVALSAALPSLTRESVEVVVVDSASTDGTSQVAVRYADRFDELVLLREEVAGKGRAVRRGMLAARGRYRMMADADFAMPPYQIGRFLEALQGDADVAIGTRASHESDVERGSGRQLVGRVFNAFTRAFLLPGLRDTQCGFKGFRAEVADCVFARSRIEGFAFDLEVLYLARCLGWRIVEVPITWRDDGDTRIRVARDGLRMIQDAARVRLLHRGVGREDAG